MSPSLDDKALVWVAGLFHIFKFDSNLSVLDGRHNFPKNSSQTIPPQKILPKKFLQNNSSKKIPPKKILLNDSKKIPQNIQKISKQCLKKFLRFWKYSIPYIALRGPKPF